MGTRASMPSPAVGGAALAVAARHQAQGPVRPGVVRQHPGAVEQQGVMWVGLGNTDSTGIGVQEGIFRPLPVGCEFQFKRPLVVEISRDSEFSTGSHQGKRLAGLRCQLLGQALVP